MRDFVADGDVLVTDIDPVPHIVASCPSAFDSKIFTEEEHRSLTEDVIEVRKMLIGLRRKLK